ncbi:hypothetical protein HX850_04795 [Marine Group I thaumarchaeote]|uniref:Uncharacterized protein n=1 Tax=Marine Group I thaumarchaeote TaxID=2511932 RepID=A0A7K4MLZ2_9ARCH|nr:hypothetical protein [Marine Group I thaumarchaeote]
MGSSQKGYDAEIVSLDILEKESFEIIYSPEKLKREYTSNFATTFTHEWVELQQKLNEYGYGVYYVERKKLYTYKDKKYLKKSKDIKLTSSQKTILSNCIDQWNEWNVKREEDNVKRGEYNDERERMEQILTDKLGESLIPKSSGVYTSIDDIDEGYFSEPWNIKFRVMNKKTLERDKKIPYVSFSTPDRTRSTTRKNVWTAKTIRIIRPTIKEIEKEIVNYSRKKGYMKLWSGFMDIESTMNIHTYVDVFCKKANDYYVFDVKHKTFKENKNLNRFYVTNYEVLNYSKIIKEDKVKLKILIIVDKGAKSFYKIFNWIDFHIPTSFDPHKSKKTSIGLKDGFDLGEFKR